MARRYGGKYSPEGEGSAEGTGRGSRIEVDPVGGRVNLLFLPPVILVFMSLGAGAGGLVRGLIAAGMLGGAVWLLRAGLLAEAAYRARKVARRPALPRKILAATLTGLGAALATYVPAANPLAPLLYGIAATGLHLAAFGVDPVKDKGLAGVDTFQRDRVARVVDEAEKLLAEMQSEVKRAGDRQAQARLDDFQMTARELIRTVEEDPRDLTAARKYLSVYLRGARDATVKFADIHQRSRDARARQDYLALLDDLDQNFAARTRKSLLEDRGDLNVEIEVLRERLSREGVRFD
ncbi:5-bromo-4-chloroindolyl phosphate hydrolysis family protein [Sulfitobacter aestuarii]|uniref:5-bromo-4-chloroindolyl phosphate hydrolysis family protein n=1 Tax=Sulfitobacter aestuarii TaxID=2161676 RepID=A0ABW5U0Y5_9RHOB